MNEVGIGAVHHLDAPADVPLLLRGVDQPLEVDRELVELPAVVVYVEHAPEIADAVNRGGVVEVVRQRELGMAVNANAQLVQDWPDAYFVEERHERRTGLGVGLTGKIKRNVSPPGEMSEPGVSVSAWSAALATVAVITPVPNTASIAADSASRAGNIRATALRHVARCFVPPCDRAPEIGSFSNMGGSFLRGGYRSHRYRGHAPRPPDAGRAAFAPDLRQRRRSSRAVYDPVQSNSISVTNRSFGELFICERLRLSDARLAVNTDIDTAGTTSNSINNNGNQPNAERLTLSL